MTSHSDEIIHRMEIRRIFRAVLDVLQPYDMPMLALRLEGLKEVQIASLLGISRTTLNAIDRDLKARIMTEVPEAWLLIRDLRHRSGPRDIVAPLERGWLSDFGAPAVDAGSSEEPQSDHITPPPPEKIAPSTQPPPGPIPPANKNRNECS